MEPDKEILVYNIGPEHREMISILAVRKEFFHQMKNLFHSLSCGRAMSHWSARNSCMSRILASN